MCHGKGRQLAKCRIRHSFLILHILIFTTRMYGEAGVRVVGSSESYFLTVTQIYRSLSSLLQYSGGDEAIE